LHLFIIELFVAYWPTIFLLFQCDALFSSMAVGCQNVLIFAVKVFHATAL